MVPATIANRVSLRVRGEYDSVVTSEHPAYARIRSKAHVTGTWDDHDYGANDAGKEYPMKAESQQAQPSRPIGIRR